MGGHISIIQETLQCKESQVHRLARRAHLHILHLCLLLVLLLQVLVYGREVIHILLNSGPRSLQHIGYQQITELLRLCALRQLTQLTDEHCQSWTCGNFILQRNFQSLPVQSSSCIAAARSI